jgi:hypothetical protein
MVYREKKRTLLAFQQGHTNSRSTCHGENWAWDTRLSLQESSSSRQGSEFGYTYMQVRSSKVAVTVLLDFPIYSLAQIRIPG